MIVYLLIGAVVGLAALSFYSLLSGGTRKAHGYETAGDSGATFGGDGSSDSDCGSSGDGGSCD